jgi:hypothetical protein
MKKHFKVLLLLIGFCFLRCSFFQSDNFAGDWIQVANPDGSDIQQGQKPIHLRIIKQDIFYIVESDANTSSFLGAYGDGPLRPYPDKSGKYILGEDKNTLVSVAFGWSIQYRDDSHSLFENSWLGYFKKE